MPQINSLAFMEIKSGFLESLRVKCAQDQSYAKGWSALLKRDPSHSHVSVQLDQHVSTCPDKNSNTQSSTPTQEELKRWKNFSIDDGYLVHKGRVCVPKDSNTRRQILSECHDSPSAGHLECLKVGGLLHPLEIPQGLSTTNHGHDAIWVIVDHLTNMGRFIPTKTTVKTPELAWLFVEHIYRHYGLLASIISDRDRKFDNLFWRAVFQKLETKLNLSTVDHPKTDGQTKSVNQVLEDMLRVYVNKKQTNWEDYLPILEFSYNSLKHVTIGFSPFMLLYEFQARSPILVGLAKEKIQQAKDFLQGHFGMLRVA
ncbi:hypothetical protein GOP47_0022369 [Adiantum capillus-veneris]|uniref:Integrase catalytic domain-containing protein n=1 Tax=Adiantum capillus-veneris TaxID=13818 RepID=A0A9D4U668_ADICA|nr:hypothetical protein GOP47_0022369 [Adiantum capillus-veneris]